MVFPTVATVVSQSLAVSYSLQPHGLQHARLLCPLLSPRICSNSCPLSWWCYLTISTSTTPFSFCPQSFPASGIFQWVGSWHQVAKVLQLQFQHQSFQWIFRISFRTDWFDLLAVQGALKSLLQNHKLSLLYGPTLTSIHDYWKTVALTIQNFVGKVINFVF